MRIILGILTLACLSFTFQGTSQTTLVSSGSSWSYYDKQNEPSNQGPLDWNDINFDSQSWSAGNAELGYGDGDEATAISNLTETAYFRHSFNIEDPNLFDALSLELIYDDGAIVYLNGDEIWRVNMPSGSVNYNTTSSTVPNDDAIATTSFSYTLAPGINILAVEVHQSSTSSSDMSFDLKMLGIAPGGVTVNRGPYLQKGSNKSMTVRWRTDDHTESVIEYGESLSNLDQVYKDMMPKKDHEVELKGLAANTKYYYRIKNKVAELIPSSEDLYFLTHPNIGSNQPIKLWILGDAGTADNNQRAVRDAYYEYIGEDHTDGILFLGDNAYDDGTDMEFQNALFSNMYEDKLKNTVSWSCLGNHDGISAEANSQTGPYFDIFTFPTEGESGGIPSGTEAYYSFDYGNIHFIALESYETNRNIGGPMYNWALNDIQNTTQEWIVAFWHHPPYSKGSHDSDFESNLIDMRKNFLPMLEENGVDLVLAGHSHSYERSYFINGHYGNSNTFDSLLHLVGPSGGGDGKTDGNGAYAKTTIGEEAGDGAVYVTTGSAGKITDGDFDHEAMYYSVSQLGSCVLEVNGNKLDVKFIRETGAIDDYFTIIKEIDDCIIGNPCDDNNECTENDIIGENCGCAGTYLPDPDGDGLCDAIDSCPAINNNLFGEPCDDGNPYTENDIYLNDCTCKGRIPGTEPKTVCVSISEGRDDVEENGQNGNMNMNSDDIDMVNVSFQTTGNQTIGLRFNNIDVPQGFEIESAHIQFTVHEKNADPANLKISGEYVDNSLPFTTSKYDVSKRTRTLASVSWNPAPWSITGMRGFEQRSPDIAPIIREIINRDGYNLANSVSLIITGTGLRSAKSHETSPNLAAELCITYIPCVDIDTNGICDSNNPDFVSFSLPEQYGETIVDSLENSISLSVVNGTDVSNLIPTFVLASGSEATVNGISQESGISEIDFSDPVIYTVTAEDKTNIQDWTVTIGIASFIEDQVSNNKIRIYPNPVKNELYVNILRLNESQVNLEIYDLFGRKINSQRITKEGIVLVDVRNYKAGIYFGIIRSESEDVLFKMLKN